MRRQEFAQGLLEGRVGPLSSDYPPVPEAEWPVEPTDVLGTRDGFGARAEYFALRGVLRVLDRSPAFARNLAIEGLSRLAPLIDRRHARAARTFIAQALGLEGRALERQVTQAYRHLMRVAVSSEGLFRRNAIRPSSAWLDVDISPQVAAALTDERGVIFASPHLGDWEAGCSALPVAGWAPMYAVAKAPRNRPLSKYIQNLRESRGILTLPRRGAMKYAPAVVEGGGTLGLLLDQRAIKKPVLAPFFGRLARCDRSAAVLVKRLSAPLVIGAVLMHDSDPWRRRLVARRVFQPEELRSLSPEEVVTRINQVFEELILSAPDQYFWLHDRYKDTPNSET